MECNNDKWKIKDINKLEKIANNIRIGIIEQVYNAQSGHPGGSLSATAVSYTHLDVYKRQY